VSSLLMLPNNRILLPRV